MIRRWKFLLHGLVGVILISVGPLESKEDIKASPSLDQKPLDQKTDHDDAKVDQEKKEHSGKRTIVTGLKDIRTWVQALGHESFRVREEATRKIKKAGSIAVPTLRDVAKSGDAEIQFRARQLLVELADQPLCDEMEILLDSGTAIRETRRQKIIETKKDWEDFKKEVGQRNRDVLVKRVIDFSRDVVAVVISSGHIDPKKVRITPHLNHWSLEYSEEISGGKGTPDLVIVKFPKTKKQIKFKVTTSYWPAAP